MFHSQSNPCYKRCGSVTSNDQDRGHHRNHFAPLCRRAGLLPVPSIAAQAPARWASVLRSRRWVVRATRAAAPGLRNWALLRGTHRRDGIIVRPGRSTARLSKRRSGIGPDGCHRPLAQHRRDVRDWKDVIWAISTRMDPSRDCTLIENTPIDYLDFASPVSGLGSKIGLDATGKWPGETQRQWGRPIVQDAGVKARIDALWDELGIN